MEVHIDIPALLLQAVDHFLAKTPEDVVEAQRLVEMCRGPRQYSFTLDSIVWAYSLAALNDSLFYEDDDELLRMRSLLTTGSDDEHLFYINLDYGRYFTESERLLRSKLVETYAFLDTLTDENAAERSPEYEKRANELWEVFLQTPQSDHPGDETLYHLVLREITTIVVHILREWWPRRLLYLASDEEMRRRWTTFFPEEPPEISCTVEWAKKALRAISGEDWLHVTWRYKSQVLLFSLH